MTQILVSGAGMIGAATALALAEAGFKVTLVDPKTPSTPPSMPQSRVSALSLESESFLSRLGVWQSLPKPSMCGYQTMQVMHSNSQTELNIPSGLIGVDHLGTIVDNQHLESVLALACDRHKQIHCLWGHHVVDASTTSVVTSAGSIVADMVVIAEGANSPTRNSLKTPYFRQSHRQTASVGLLQVEQAHQNVARQWFTPIGPLALLPLADPHLLSFVWSIDEQNAATLDQHSLMSQLNLHVNQTFKQVTLISELSQFPLWQRLTHRPTQPHITYIGDSAHSIHPLAGLGANLGFRDSQAIEKAIKFNRDLALPLSHARGWSQFYRTRTADNAMTSHLMRLFQLGMGGQGLYRTVLQKKVMQIGNSLLAKQILAQLANGQPHFES